MKRPDEESAKLLISLLLPVNTTASQALLFYILPNFNINAVHVDV